MRNPSSFERPRGVWRLFAHLDQQGFSTPVATALGVAAFAAWWMLARGALLLCHDAPDQLDQHLGGLSALVVIGVGLLHRRWYHVERPRWWARVRATMATATDIETVERPVEDPRGPC